MVDSRQDAALLAGGDGDMQIKTRRDYWQS